LVIKEEGDGIGKIRVEEINNRTKHVKHPRRNLLRLR
jgi:hypothetical protein